MAAGADALIYHPTVSHYLKYVGTTVGRDKALRLLQYFSRFYAWYLLRTNALPSTIAPFEATKKQLGLTRKILRIGKFVEHFRAAAVASDAKGMDSVLRVCGVGRQLGYAGYLLLDALTVPDAAGIKKYSRAKTFQSQAYKFWATGLFCNIVAGIYSLYHLRARALTVTKTEADSAVESKKIEKERNATTIQLISDVCDITVPASAVGWVDLDDGVVGLAGTLSSLLGIQAQWKKTA